MKLREAACLLILISYAGCADPNEKMQQGTSAGPDGATAQWPFWPVKMRVHPLTRLATDPATDQQVIEARVEFFDATEDPTKGVGELRLDLHEVVDDEAGGEPIATWSRDLRDLPTNRLHFDDVTRTYLFRLEIDPSLLPDDGELRAYFLSIDERKLSGDLRLRMTRR